MPYQIMSPRAVFMGSIRLHGTAARVVVVVAKRCIALSLVCLKNTELHFHIQHHGKQAHRIHVSSFNRHGVGVLHGLMAFLS